MCGIFGIWHPDHRPLSLDVVQRATTLLRHRGPDDEGYLLVNTQSGRVVACGGRDTDIRIPVPTIERLPSEDFDLAFGFRRLAILDLSPAGHQPMCSHDGRYWIIFNGEIYNFIELRAELSALGHRFSSGSDTEVILAAYAQWGAAMLPRFVGMFAFAILDVRERTLFLARDFFGIKPLYYTTAGDQFAFASEIKALLALPRVSRRVNSQCLYQYLRLGLTDHSAETMFADVHQLLAAHYLEVELNDGRLEQPRRYWNLPTDRQTHISYEEAAAKFRDIFMESVRLHLRSDVPVGSCLSGGIDSSSIVMVMRQLDGSALNLHTFSAVFDDAAIGEEKYVDIAAQAANVIIHKTQPTAEELVADLDDLVYLQEEPFGSTSIYAQQRVFRLAGKVGIKVMLDGQGADELLGGYRPFLNARLASLIGRGRWLEAGRLLAQVSSLPDTDWRRVIMGAMSLITPSSLRAPLRHLSGWELVPSWLNLEWFTSRGLSLEQSVSSWKHCRHFVLRRYQYETITRSSLPGLLRYEDRNSMSHSIESRVPFLTPALAEFALSLPEEFIVSQDATSKAVFRSAMRGLVPDAILDRKDKIGFATPERIWLTTLKPWIDHTLSSISQDSIPYLNLPQVMKEWEMVAVGVRPFDWRVWRWINVIRWMDIYRVAC